MSIPFPPNSPLQAAEFFGGKDNIDDQEFSRKKVEISYTKSGRKMQDGIRVKPYEPKQLWKKLLPRAVIHQFYVKATRKSSRH
jgi:hypothetical protein